MARGTRIDTETSQLTIRVSRRVALRAERLIDHVGRSLGVPATRTDVVREAILRGLDVLEQEVAGKPTGTAPRDRGGDSTAAWPMRGDEARERPRATAADLREIVPTPLHPRHPTASSKHGRDVPRPPQRKKK